CHFFWCFDFWLIRPVAECLPTWLLNPHHICGKWIDIFFAFPDPNDLEQVTRGPPFQENPAAPLVGDTGIEPVTSSVSRKRASPCANRPRPEKTTRARRLESMRLGSGDASGE